MGILFIRAGTPVNSFSSTFSNTENPISEGGIWINGGTDGLDWQDIQTASGYAFGTGNSPFGGDYNDPIAHLNPSRHNISVDHYIEATVFKTGDAPADGSAELELLLRFEITANNARGYEILCPWAGGGQVMRWNGPVNDFTDMSANGALDALVDGDVIRAQIIGNDVKVYQNGVLKMTASPTTWSDGNPGMGFFARTHDMTTFGWKDFITGNAT